jgi:transcriptional regulator with XRE-family HTH domain
MSGKPSQDHYTRRTDNLISALVIARKEAGVSQAEVAAELGLNQPDISKIESGERRLDVIEFLLFVELLERRTGNSLLNTLVAASLFQDE